MFDYLVRDNGGVALQIGDESHTYKELLQWSDLYAELLTKSSSERIDKVMFYAKAAPHMIFAIYGALRYGATVVPVDVTAADRDVTYIINDSRPEVIYCTQDDKPLLVQMVQSIEDEAYKPFIITQDNVDASRLSQMEGREILPRGAQDVMTIIYTSGTTGSPKGVMLTYENLWYNVNAVVNDVPIFSAESRMLMILPLHHIFAFAGALLAPMYAGTKSYIAEQLTPESIIDTLQRGKITIMLGVPRLYEGFAKGIMGKINQNGVAKLLYKICSAVGSQALSKRVFKSVHDKFGGSMEFFVSGGAALPHEVGRIFKNLGFYILEGYGMTECAPMIAFTRPGEWKVGSNGRLLPGCEHRIEPSGELLVRGKNVMKGYYNRPEETAKIMEGGWLHTGDTVTYDEKDGLRVTGRIKEIIVTSNGKNINPAEIENLITEQSVVIKEAAVVLHDDVLQALVFPDLNAARSASGDGTLDELVRSEIERYNNDATSYKRIMRYQILSQELPKTRLGKIQRFKLKDFIKAKEEAPREDVSGRSEVFLMLKKFVDEQTNAYANGDSHFEIDLALDSLGRVSLISFVEDSFALTIEEAQLAELSTLNLLSEYVESRSQEISSDGGSLDWADILSTSQEELTLPKSGFVHWLFHSFLWFFFTLFYRYKATGVENVPSGPVLYVANHRSGFDGAFVAAKLGWGRAHRTMFFAKNKHFNSGWRRYLAARNNIIIMNINTNVRKSMQQMYRVLEMGYSVIIFPEGTRSKDGSTQAFKESFAILSSVADVPVVPIAIEGSERATTTGRLPNLGADIRLTFMPAVKLNEGEGSLEFAERVRGIIRSSIANS